MTRCCFTIFIRLLLMIYWVIIAFCIHRTSYMKWSYLREPASDIVQVVKIKTDCCEKGSQVSERVWFDKFCSILRLNSIVFTGRTRGWSPLYHPDYLLLVCSGLLHPRSRPFARRPHRSGPGSTEQSGVCRDQSTQSHKFNLRRRPVGTFPKRFAWLPFRVIT